MKEKIIKITVLIIGLLIVAGLVFWLVIKNDPQDKQNVGSGSALDHTEFMTDKEKTDFQLSADSKIQVIGRDEKGQISVYRIINDDQDVISDPSQLLPISPRVK